MHTLVSTVFLIILYQVSTPDLKSVPVVAIIIQVLRYYVGVVKGLVHAVLTMLVVSRWGHMPSRPTTSPIVPAQQTFQKILNPLPIPVVTGKFLRNRGIRSKVDTFPVCNLVRTRSNLYS